MIEIIHYVDLVKCFNSLKKLVLIRYRLILIELEKVISIQCVQYRFSKINLILLVTEWHPIDTIFFGVVEVLHEIYIMYNSDHQYKPSICPKNAEPDKKLLWGAASCYLRSFMLSNVSLWKIITLLLMHNHMVLYKPSAPHIFMVIDTFDSGLIKKWRRRPCSTTNLCSMNTR